jgi:hypothetical protein
MYVQLSGRGCTSQVKSNTCLLLSDVSIESPVSVLIEGSILGNVFRMHGFVAVHCREVKLIRVDSCSCAVRVPVLLLLDLFQLAMAPRQENRVDQPPCILQVLHDRLIRRPS